MTATPLAHERPKHAHELRPGDAFRFAGSPVVHICMGTARTEHATLAISTTGGIEYCSPAAMVLLLET